MNRTLTASELALWPLMHGNLLLETVVDSIRIEGLRAPGADGRAAHSFNYDRVLGRTESVFLSPIRLRGGYGLGSVVLVDPAVLSLPGVRCALYDIGAIVRQVDYLVADPGHRLPEWLLAPQVLKDIVQEHRRSTEQCAISEGIPPSLRAAWVEQHTKQNVVKSPAFSAYTGAYLMEPNVFLSALAARYSEAGCSLRDFIERDGNGPVEEVLVPHTVEPTYLLGYRSDDLWHSWRRPETRDVAERLDELVALWASTSRGAS